LKKLKLFLAFSVLVAMAPGCKKDGCKSKSPQSEAAQLQAYATANGITPTVHSTGLYYEIIDEGTGAAPTATSKVVITYTGRFLDNQIFSQQTTPNNTAENPAWPLSDLIEGWRIGLPLIKKGGHIKLIIPSSQAYGCTGRGAIPGNTPLFFDVQLVDVQ